MLYKYLSSLIFTCLFLFSCKNEPINQTTEHPIQQRAETKLKYAKRFSIIEENGFKKVMVFGNRNSLDTTATFILYTDSIPKQINPPNRAIKVPCKRIAALSSIYARAFFELGALENLIAIDNIDYINCESILEKHRSGNLQEISKGIELNIEQTLVLKPDMIFGFGMGDWERDKNKKVEQAGMAMAISIDHLEESPLARAEWIKFFAAFVNKSELADSIFDEVEKNYQNLTKKAAQALSRPSVFNEIKYSDSWYMPGGKSYIAQLLKDAGADYVWKENTEFGSLPLSFEQVYAKAKDADFWINLSTVNSKSELLAYEKRYSEFKAFKTGNLYNNNRYSNAKGYSIYWETGMLFPNKILSDLIQIFHPEMFNEGEKNMNYYKKLD